MNHILSHTIADEEMILSPLKAMYWPRKKMLIIGDLHLGKTSYFRQNGIQVPLEAKEKNWSRLRSLLIDFKPERVVFLGDLFHSRLTRDYDRLKKLISKYPDIDFELVRGNHDILRKDQYEGLRIQMYEPVLVEEPFIFSHEEIEADSMYPISAHIHPAVKFIGNGRQSVSLECFYFGEFGAVIPAFGSFTGHHKIRPKKTDSVFVVLPDKVLEVS